MFAFLIPYPFFFPSLKKTLLVLLASVTKKTFYVKHVIHSCTHPDTYPVDDYSGGVGMGGVALLVT